MFEKQGECVFLEGANLVFDNLNAACKFLSESKNRPREKIKAVEAFHGWDVHIEDDRQTYQVKKATRLR